MKNICFITTIPMTLDMFILKIAKYLHAKGDYNITFICNNEKSELKNKLPNYINFLPIKMKRGISISGIISIYQLYKIFKKEKFDLIQYCTPNASLYSSLAGRLAGIKNRLYCQWGIRYVGFTGIKRKVFKLLEKITCHNSTWIEPDSFGNLEFSHKEGLYSENKSSVVWNGSASGIDFEKFDISKKEIWKNEIKTRYNLKDNLVIGFIGRIDKDKGINELLEAFKNLNTKSIKLLIVGPNDKPETINKELFRWAQKNENIIFTGKVSDTEKYYSAMDVFVLPSYREGFGSVVIEAQAMGVPVIVTNIPGPTEAMKENATGIVVKKRDANALKKAIERLINDPNSRKQMSENSVKFVKERFDNQKLFKYIMEDRNRLILNNSNI